MAQRITIDPITRLEGHGKIEIFLNDDGDVANTYFQIPELRGFERFCRRPPGGGNGPADQPHLRRLPGGPPHGGCQGCRCRLPRGSAAHRQDAARAALHAPSIAPTTPPTSTPWVDRTSSSVRMPRLPSATSWVSSTRSGWRSAARSSRCASTVTTVVEMIGGRKVHPCTSIPGGLTKGITEEQRVEIEQMGRWAIEFAQFSLQALQ